MPDPKALLDGEVVPLAEARVPPTDRSFLYGDGVFETVRAYEGHVFRLDDHLDRLRRSAGAIALPLPWDDEALGGAIHAALDANDRTDGLARITVTRGDGWGPDVPEPDPRLVVLTKPVPEREEPVELDIVEGSPPLPQAKTCNRLVHITARMKARARDFDDAVLADDGRLVEATSANLFFVEDEAVLTPPAPPALDGVTRRVVLRIADRIGVRVREEPVTEDRAARADDAFVTSTCLEVHPVACVGSRRYTGTSKLVERLMRAFSGQVEEDRAEAEGS